MQRGVRDFYTDHPSGIIGNDDCGQMSAWYLLSTLGLYPMVPASGQYVLGAPQVRAATVQLADGKTQRLSAEGFAAGFPHAAQATPDGRAVDPKAIDHVDLARGGALLFRMRQAKSQASR